MDRGDFTVRVFIVQDKSTFLCWSSSSHSPILTQTQDQTCRNTLRFSFLCLKCLQRFMGHPHILIQVLCWGPVYHDGIVFDWNSYDHGTTDWTQLKSNPSPSRVVRGDLLPCPVCFGWVPCETVLGTTMEGVKAPGYSLAMEGHTLDCCVQHFRRCPLAYFSGELNETVLKRDDHQQVFYSRIPNKGLLPLSFSMEVALHRCLGEDIK